MGSDGVDAAALHQDDAVRVLYAGHALGDDDLGGLWDKLAEALADQGVGLGVNRAGGVVQDEDLGLFEQGPGNAKALLLAAGYIGSALLDPGVVLIRKLLDKFVGLGQLTGLYELLVRGVRIAPAQVVLDGSGEKNIFWRTTDTWLRRASRSYLRTSSPPTFTLPSVTS